MLTAIKRWIGSLVESRATPENPSFNLNDPDAWDELFDGRESDSGIKVNHRKSLRIPAVWQAVNMISGAVARMHLDVYERVGDDERKKAKQHPAYKLVRKRANREMAAFKFWRTLMVHRLLWTNGFAYIDRNGRGEPIELLPLLPDRTGLVRRKQQLYVVTELSKGPNGENGWLQPIPAENVLHLCGLSITGLEGCDLVKNARDSFGRNLAAAGFTSKFFRHGARSAGTLELPKEMGKTARDRVEEGFTKHHEGPDNWFKTIILRDGAKFHRTSINPKEGEMSETRVEEAREVARWFNLDPSRLGVQGSVSYNSRTEANRQYLDDTLAPLLEEITSECALKLLSQDEQEDDTHYFEHNTNTLLRMNAIERHQVYAIGIRNSIYSPNEVRRMENQPPREGGDEYMPFAGAPKPGNPAPGSSDGGGDKIPADPSAPKEGEEPEGGDQEPDKQTRMRRVLFSMTARARHKAKNARAFIEWIDGDLKSHRQEAIELLGPEADKRLVDPLLAELRKLAESKTETELPAAVDELTARFESEPYQTLQPQS